MLDRYVRSLFSVVVIAVACWALGAPTPANAQVEKGNEALWYFSPAIGQVNYEGDDDFEDGFIMDARLGYDWTEWWSLEGVLYLAPSLKANRMYRDVVGTRPDGSKYYTGDRELRSDPGVKDTYGLGLAVDALYHFTRWSRLDPFLTVGGAAMWYGHKADGENFDPAFRVGGGVMYHFNDEWAMRADIRTYVAGKDVEANMIIDAGLVWHWGARVSPGFVAVGGPVDSDGDGLLDSKEAEIGTDPYDPDTDKDKLSDGEEVNTYRTDPLNPDTDWDRLTDGAEVLTHKTNPLVRDTDKGGVDDGHEVIDDHTNPLDPSDDLQLFELNIQFDYDKAVVKPEYFAKIDVIGKVLQRHPEATALIEGHADKLKKSSARHNRKLSQQRAEAVATYLNEKAGIAKSRMKAVGYGFDRPRAPNDPINGNPANRRVEVYIRNAGANEAVPAAKAVMANPAVIKDQAPDTK